MKYSETIEFLYGLRLFGTKLGLENTFGLAALFDNPQRNLRFIHVAGTNGKGSTCAMLESIYRHAGYKTGLFTSPHLVSFTERIQVNRENISEADVTRLTENIIQRLGGNDTTRWPFRPTFFEFVTILGLLYFNERQCELVIWETGMGGRLDATNIVTPLATLITTIQFDHQQWLGSTLREIAAEKAGIIKPGVPVLTAVDSAEALDVIRARATELNAPIAIVHDADQARLSLAGAHQRKNAALARATVETLQGTFPVRSATIDTALANTFWAGRLQLVEWRGGRLLLDGAHNPDGALTLAEALKTGFEGQPLALILGLFKDKDWQRMCEILVPLSRAVTLVPVQSDRSANPAEVRDYCAQRWPNIAFRNAASLRAGLESMVGSPLVVLAGSLLLIGEALEILGLAPEAKPERELNEWDAGRTKGA